MRFGGAIPTLAVLAVAWAVGLLPACLETWTLGPLDVGSVELADGGCDGSESGGDASGPSCTGPTGAALVRAGPSRPLTPAGRPPAALTDAGDDAGADANGGADSDAGEDGGTDAGSGSGNDAGQDAGRDAGTDGGSDAGSGTRPPLDTPTVAGWRFYGPAEGAPREVFGVSSDGQGNLWVAGGDEGLFLLPAGAGNFKRFTAADGLTPFLDASGLHTQKVISVAGGPGGSAFAGLHGHASGFEEGDPQNEVHSGGVDRVKLEGTRLTVTHLEVASPPGKFAEYPAGRYKIRDVLRIAYDASTGDAWLGGNHGIALWNGPAAEIQEHQHVAINGYLPSGAFTLLSGDYYGIGLDPSGDVWFGGGHRLGRLKFATEGRQFWADIDPVLDVWPDAQPYEPRPNERTDDLVQDLAVAPDGSVWVGSIPNGLAHVTPTGNDFYRAELADPRVTSLELDPKDGSLWVGHLYGGLTRLKGGQARQWGPATFGQALVNVDVPDIQSDTWDGRRRILVAFRAGAVGVYTGD